MKIHHGKLDGGVLYFGMDLHRDYEGSWSFEIRLGPWWLLVDL